MNVVSLRRAFAVTLVVLTAVLMSGCSSSGIASSGNSSQKSDTTSTGADQSGASNGKPSEKAFAGEVGFQMTPTHADYSSDDVGPDWGIGWTKTLGSQVSYPLVAGGNMFVYTQGSAADLYSFDLSTGNLNWEKEANGVAGMSYADGVLFITQIGAIFALNPNTGQTIWSTNVGSESLSTPTAADGMVFFSGSDGMGRSYVYGVEDASGSIAWSESVNDADISTPAVSSSGVYVAYSCDRIYDFDPSNGTLLWKHLTSCEGGGGDVPVLDGSYLLVEEDYRGIVLNASTGMPPTGDVEGGFPASEPPAATADDIILIDNGQLGSQSFPLGRSLWTTTGDSEMDTAPLVVNGTIYEGSRTGVLYAFSAISGTREWTEKLSAPIDENIGEGDDHLAVPAGDTVTVLRAQS
jgi:outer membrane protein assembly factor BamB